MKYTNIIFDGSNAAHRISSALPPLNNNRGERVEVVFGLLKLLSSVSRLNPASRCWVAMDGKGSRAIRQAIDPVYKDRRGSNFTEEDKARVEGMHAQVELFWQLFGQFLPIYWCVSNRYEADDIMAMIANEGASKDETSLIVSGDGDMLQLVSDKIHVFSPSRNDTCTVAKFEKYTKGFPNSLAWLYGKVLQGEPPTGDNIPGIKGMGEATAKKFLEASNWDLLDMLQNPPDSLSSSAVGQRVFCDEGRARISKNYKLMSLRGHKILRRDKVEVRIGSLNKTVVQTNMAKNQFSSLLASFNQFINPFMSFGR